MPFTLAQMIRIPGSAESSFDHGAFEPRTRRVFVTHTGRNRVEVLTSETMSHVATLPGFPHAAGVVADDGTRSSPTVGQRASLGSMPRASSRGP
jgi:hypothetical protein